MKSRIIQGEPGERLPQTPDASDPATPELERPINLSGRIAGWSIRHRKIAIFGWLGFVVVAFALGSVAGQKTLDPATSGPGESGRVDRILEAGFKQPASESVLIQSQSLTASAASFRSAIEDVVGTVSALDTVQNVRSPLDAANAGQISKDGHSALRFAVTKTTRRTRSIRSSRQWTRPRRPTPSSSSASSGTRAPTKT
jgi:hypothetical protein